MNFICDFSNHFFVQEEVSEEIQSLKLEVKCLKTDMEMA
jgi:hypothetical protein